MSIKLRVKYKVRKFKNFWKILRLPRWAYGLRMRIFLVVGIALLTVGYVIQTNTLSTSGYEIQSIESEISALTTEIKKVETEVASFRSIESIEKRLANINMVEVGKITYLQTEQENKVAAK
jgi:cell division protein FtsL